MTLRRTFQHLLCGLLCLLPGACDKPDEETLLTDLSIRLVMPDSRPVLRLEIIGERSYFENINTYERTPFPAVAENRAAVHLRKGVYTFTVEAWATYGSGQRQLLRCADYNQPMQAVTWVRERESIVLLLQDVK